MRAVILAAGQGTRIRSVHGERPKCLIEIEGRAILDHQIQALSMAGVHEIAVVVGYKKAHIMAHVARTHYPGVTIRFIENPAFASTNNICSLWAAADWLRGESFVCLNADVVLEPGILLPALQSRTPITMIVDPEWRDETMKVITVGNRVVRMSKAITRQEFSGTYIGITVFHYSIYERFFEKVNEVIFLGRVNEFFNSAVQELVHEGVHVGFTSTDALPWAEIDEPCDLSFAQGLAFSPLEEGATALVDSGNYR